MFLFIYFFVMAIFILATAFLTALASAFRRIHKKDTQKIIVAAGNTFFYRKLHRFFFPHHEYEGLYFATICAQYLCRYFFIGSTVIFLLGTPLFIHTHGELISASPGPYEFTYFWIILAIAAILFFSFIITDYIPRIIGLQLPEKVIRFCSPYASLFMVLAFPITFTFLKLSESFSRTVYYDNLQEPEAIAKQEIIDIIRESEMPEKFDRHDKEMLESVFSFRQRNAREVMVPRVNLFAVPSSLTIREATKLISTERYSRIPIYRNTIDEIDGMVMYKDILAKFLDAAESGNPALLDSPIETLRKNVLYTPETKKISNLLQEFRKKHVHFAIVVDEYGGTEGIVTIEDILEEIVGEISDEYDEQESLYIHQPDGSWIVDARMSIFDVEELIGIDIPQEGDYDTIGGYMFNCAGAIPQVGFTIHQDEFEAEVMRTSERSIEKVRIKPFNILGKGPTTS